MKKIYLNLFLFSFRRHGLPVFIGCFFFNLLVGSVAAQGSASVAPLLPISTEDLTQAVDWKTPVDYANVIASERVIASQQLASFTPKQPGFALYTAYDRMLAYMQQAMIDNLPADEIAPKNYARVLSEAPADPLLGNLDGGEFNNLYTALLGKLHQ